VTTRDLVLAGLKEAGETGLGGEELARALGVSRVAVSKQVGALRSMGYVIDASPRAGYRLRSSPDAAVPTEVRPLLADPLWVRVEGGAETGSTNDDARVLATAGAPEGTLVIAARQRSGRGRLGRSWESPEGGAYVSAVLRPPVAPAQAGPLALVIALGIARGLEQVGLEPGLKWPNDVWLGGGKVAGVLLEMTAEGDRVRWLVAGFGLNVRRTASSPKQAAYVSDVAPGVGVPAVAAAAIDGVAQAYRDWLGAGFSALSREFDRRSVLAGREVTVRDADGEVRFCGRAEGVDQTGRLRLLTERGVQAVVAGDVTLRE